MAAPGSSDVIGKDFPAGMKVLLVEDNEPTAMLVCAMIRRCRYDVTHCEGVKVALQLLKERKAGFDLVICKVDLQDMDGFKLLEHVRDIPVMLMSADIGMETLNKAFGLGAWNVIQIPVDSRIVDDLWIYLLQWKIANKGNDQDPPNATI